MKLTGWQRARSLESTAAAVALLNRSSTAAPAVQRAARKLDAWLRPSVKLSWERGYRPARNSKLRIKN
jgi:hypothetical protein